MKRVCAFLLIFCTLMMISPVGVYKSEAAVAFKDVPTDAWYYTHVKYVTEDPRQLMVGFAGNFGPLDNLTVEQFIKITVAAAGRSVTVPQGQYWGDVYTPIGLELGFVLPGEFTDYKRPITRAEMSRIIVRALPSITGEKDITYDVNVIKSRMTDYDSIPAHLKDYVCKCYQLGILVGGSDKKFNPNGTLTRASAAAVIHNMLDPAVRTPVVVEAAAEMWSDAEFEAYLRSSDGTYINVTPISKIENRKIYWKTDKGTNVLIPETNNPGVNEMVYNIIKIVSYHTLKTKGYLAMSYLEGHFGGIFSFDYYRSKSLMYVSNEGDVCLGIFVEPIKSWTGDKYFPGQQKGLSNYWWIFGSLCDTSKDIVGYEYGMDRSKFHWTMPRYEEIMQQVAMEVYGPTQGMAFFNYVIQECDKWYVIDEKYSAEFIGIKPEIGVELIYHYPDSLAYPQFWTSKPEVRK